MMSRTLLSLFLLACCLGACALAVEPAGGRQRSCALPNGGTCAAGASCPAGDGCNECACLNDGSLQCTQRACSTGCDGGAGCAADASVADVSMPHPTPCQPDGQMCGSDYWCCGGYCDQSDGGPGACRPVPPGTFPCGTTFCRAGEYCELTYSDVPMPDSSVCRPIPTACNGTPSCACVPQTCATACSQRDSETIVFRCPGG
jgi:hypothetical protein